MKQVHVMPSHFHNFPLLYDRYQHKFKLTSIFGKFQLHCTFKFCNKAHSCIELTTVSYFTTIVFLEEEPHLKNALVLNKYPFQKMKRVLSEYDEYRQK